MWRIMAIVYELLQQKKTMTQREIYYYLAKEFRNQQVALDSPLSRLILLFIPFARNATTSFWMWLLC